MRRTDPSRPTNDIVYVVCFSTIFFQLAARAGQTDKRTGKTHIAAY